MGIPFGATYFPPELALPGKEVLGLRMFLFSTAAAQLAFTFSSRFDNGVGLQMVEVRGQWGARPPRKLILTHPVQGSGGSGGVIAYLSVPKVDN